MGFKNNFAKMHALNINHISLLLETQIERKRRKYREYAARAKERKRLKALGFQVPTRSKEIIPGETREERRRRLNRLRKAKSRQKLRAERGTVGDHSLFGEGVFDDEGLVRCDAVTGEEGQLRGDTIAGANGNDVLLHGADGLPGGPDDDRPYEGHSGHWLIDGILGEDFVGGGSGQGHAAGDDGASGKPRGRRKKAEDQKFYWQDPVTGEYIEETYDERKKRLNRESKVGLGWDRGAKRTLQMTFSVHPCVHYYQLMNFHIFLLQHWY